ncbi:MAG: prepilin-type N-terminal cleavage/methylation domain-containing protein [Candidatus Shapirobacteria bacterium]|nr:prepilin-type N-terminal cleavage/methylation domain-containing protein [Candidatus Shapirobacteria bacterium]
MKNTNEKGHAYPPRRVNWQAGFSLFELLISISIIGILTALAVISFSSAQKKARDTKRIEDMKNIQTAAEQYYSLSSTYSYPSTTSAPTAWTINGQAVLNLFPQDPKGTGWTGYVYSAGTTYCACAAMEDATKGNSTDNNCAFNNTVGAYPFFCIKNQQ